MKSILLTAALVTGLILGGNSFALSHGGEESLHPTPSSDLFTVLSEFSDMENFEILLQKLNDPDPFVRVEAVQALGEIQKNNLLSRYATVSRTIIFMCGLMRLRRWARLAGSILPLPC